MKKKKNSFHQISFFTTKITEKKFSFYFLSVAINLQKMHQSDYCVQTSVLKLSDTKKAHVQIWQLQFITC